MLKTCSLAKRWFKREDVTGIRSRGRRPRARGGDVAVSGADPRGLRGARGADGKGKTLALGQNLPVDGSVRAGGHPQKEIFGCLFIWDTKKENVLLKASMRILWGATG